jgi:hypothetical protein
MTMQERLTHGVVLHTIALFQCRSHSVHFQDRIPKTQLKRLTEEAKLTKAEDIF